MLSLPAPAKLNLFLHITGRRADGYHELQTCFQLLDYGDRLEFTLSETPGIELSFDPGTQISTLNPEDNLIVKAAALLQQSAKVPHGAAIHLSKILPMGAGLGGGSSDAATTLLGLNKLWNCGFTEDQLAELGLSLGADVPVFVRGHSGWAEGVGEKLTALSLPERWYLVISPPCQVSTRQIFSHEQLTRNSSTITIPAFPFSGTRNDCEAVAVALYPEIGSALQWLNGYASARMTGTGSSIFASFDSRAAAQKVLTELPQELTGFVAKGINLSPALLAL
tara:strand:- start:826 stop:1665 length:840 start_codon:yes stop_codon:yes gene_type:complete